MENCVFEGNVADLTHGWGGGIYAEGGTLTLTGCVFTGNEARGNPSSDPGYGGGIYCESSTVIVTGSVFDGNSARYGGGIYAYGATLSVTGCVLVDNVTLLNGGGIMQEGTGTQTIANCTFMGNQVDEAASAAGLFFGPGVTGTVTNCIFWKNIADSHALASMSPASDSVTVTYSLVQIDGSGTYPGTGNLNEDPMFVDQEDPIGDDGQWWTDDDGLRLGAGSPCIGTGDGGVDMGAYF